MGRQLLHVKAVVIQANVRAFLVRKRLTEDRKKRSSSASIIQKHYQDHAQAVTVTEAGDFGKDKRESKATYEIGKEALKVATEGDVQKTQNQEAARASLGEVFR